MQPPWPLSLVVETVFKVELRLNVVEMYPEGYDELGAGVTALPPFNLHTSAGPRATMAADENEVQSRLLPLGGAKSTEPREQAIVSRKDARYKLSAC